MDTDLVRVDEQFMAGPDNKSAVSFCGSKSAIVSLTESLRVNTLLLSCGFQDCILLTSTRSLTTPVSLLTCRLARLTSDNALSGPVHASAAPSRLCKDTFMLVVSVRSSCVAAQELVPYFHWTARVQLRPYFAHGYWCQNLRTWLPALFIFAGANPGQVPLVTP